MREEAIQNDSTVSVKMREDIRSGQFRVFPTFDEAKKKCVVINNCENILQISEYIQSVKENVS